MKILFMGAPLFAQVVLEHLIQQGFYILGLVTQPSKPFGRSKQLKDTPTKTFLQQHDPTIPIFEPAKIDAPFMEKIRALKPDAIVVVAYGKILPQAFLDIAPCINLHGSLLPQFRGASPMQEMILHDLPTFGVSVIAMSAEMDAGDILGTASFKPKGYLNLGELGAHLAPMGAQLLGQVLNNLAKITPKPQDHAQATYCKKISKTDGLVAFGCAKSLFLKSLAYDPWPGVFLKSGLKLFGVQLLESSQTHQPGIILGMENQSVIIGCQQGSLKIAALQAPGKQKVAAKAYLSGRRLKTYDILEWCVFVILKPCPPPSFICSNKSKMGHWICLSVWWLDTKVLGSLAATKCGRVWKKPWPSLLPTL